MKDPIYFHIASTHTHTHMNAICNMDKYLPESKLNVYNTLLVVGDPHYGMLYHTLSTNLLEHSKHNSITIPPLKLFGNQN